LRQTLLKLGSFFDITNRSKILTEILFCGFVK